MKRTEVVWWAAVAVVVVAAGFLLGRERTSGPPLDPGSTDPLGTRALVELLEAFDAEVTRRPPTTAGDDPGPSDDPGPGDDGDDGAPEADTALVLQDELDDATRDRLVGWVRAGGVLVVADPSSPLSPEPVAALTEQALPAGTCTVPALAGVEAVEAGSFLQYPVEPGAGSCFGTTSEAWLVARAEGAGTIVVLGGAAAFTNDRLDEAGNAALATALLTPRPGTRVAIVYDPVAVGGGDATLADLVPRRVWWAIAQLGVAVGVYLLWRARRFGRPVPEPQVVALPGSLLVQARGDLYRRARSHQRVATELRRDAERRIRRHLGLSPDAPLPVAEVAARTGATEDDVQRLLLAPDLPDRAGDVAHLAADLDRLLAPLDAVDGLEPQGAPSAQTARPSGATR